MVESALDAKPTFKFDAIKFAKTILSEVEQARGYTARSGDDKSIGGNQTASESRVNAFFRLIGLPMILAIEPEKEKNKKSTGQTSGPQVVRTPGYVKGGQIRAAKIQDSEQAKVKDPKPKTTTSSLRSVLRDRETQLLNREAAIGTTQTNKDMEAAFRNPLNLQMDAIQDNIQVDLGRKIFKRLSPFITSYREIVPANRDTARPFLANPSKGFFSGQELKRPFIETVIRIRIINTSEGSDTAKKNYLDQLQKDLETLKEKALDDKKELQNVHKLLPEKGELLEAFIIKHMITAIGQLARKWVTLQRNRENLLNKVEVSLAPQTASAKQNPLGKQTNTGLSALAKKKSELGSRISKLQARIAASEAILGLLPTEDSVKTHGLSAQFSVSRNVMSNALTGPFISILRQDLDKELKQLASIKNKLKEMSQKADRLRLEMEMMSGEFTGLSIPDIIFTMLGLFLIDQEDLLALLDADTLNEMKKSPNKALKTAAETISANSANTLKAAEKLREKVDGLYGMLAAFINLVKTRSGPATASSRAKQKTGTGIDRRVSTKNSATQE